MAKTKISEFNSNPALNTDIDSINIAEGCSPSGINDAIRELMSQLKDFQTGAVGDSFNGPVGTTTAAAGAFTTLAASGAVTLSGGTANGVAYLNGSKVVTSGSALTFDGTSLTFGSTGQRIIADMSNATQSNRLFFQNSVANASTSVGVMPSGTGTSARVNVFNNNTPDNASYLQLAVAAGEAYLLSSATGTGTALPFGISVGGGTRYSISTAGESSWYIGSEQMRLTSTGLGIGTSSPSQKLHVVGNALVTPSGGWTTGGVATQYFGDIYGSIKYDYNTTNFLISSYGTFSIATNGISPATRLTVDSSGNLGLGVTPSAWGSNLKAIQVGDYAAFATNVSNAAAIVASNCYNNDNTNWRYSFTGVAAARYEAALGAHKWFNAPSGTSGNAITFSQAMTLDVSGNLLVGTTSQISNEKLSVVTGNTTGMVVKTTGGATYVPIYSWNATTTGDGYFAGFFTEATATFRGSITYNRGAGVVAYNVTSDYRAKDISGPVTGSGALIDSTPVYMGKMKGATQERPMFIAHETPEYAHTGEKDAVDEDGNPVYQQMDASALIPVMWAEIQSLRKRLADAGL